LAVAGGRGSNLTGRLLGRYFITKEARGEASSLLKISKKNITDTILTRGELASVRRKGGSEVSGKKEGKFR